jgi:hypothetical protein
MSRSILVRIASRAFDFTAGPFSPRGAVQDKPRGFLSGWVLNGWGPAVVGGARPCYGVSGGVLLSHTLAGAVPSALWALASGFGMGPGVSPTL